MKIIRNKKGQKWRVLDGETEIKNKKQLKEIKDKLEKLINKEIIRIESMRVPDEFYDYIKGLTKDMDFFIFRAFKDEELLDIEIQEFLRKYKRYIRKKEKQNSLK